MSDIFTPLVATPVSAGEAEMLSLKVLPQSNAKAIFEPLSESVRQQQTAQRCGTPSVTLQKQGEVVSGIRIECGCGQVIELACSY
jgi:hypothetical protein